MDKHEAAFFLELAENRMMITPTCARLHMSFKTGRGYIENARTNYGLDAEYFYDLLQLTEIARSVLYEETEKRAGDNQRECTDVPSSDGGGSHSGDPAPRAGGGQNDAECADCPAGAARGRKRDKKTAAAERRMIRVLVPVPVYDSLRPPVGAVLEAEMSLPKPKGNTSLPFCIVDYAGTRIVLRKGEYEVVGEA